MNKIDVKGFVFKRYKILAEKVADSVLQLMGQPDGLEIAIHFVCKNAIRKLNRELRSIDKVTDVLSFPSTETKAGEIIDVNSADIVFLKTEENCVHIGDVAICYARCKKQAKEFGNTIDQEIKKLVIHSVLHLLGYDHIDDNDYDVMNKKEIELESLIKF